MAHYGFQLKHGSRARNQSAGAHARYILREGKYVYNRQQLLHSGVGNMPSWVESSVSFWDAADKYEAPNARLYSEFVITLPREISLDGHIALIEGFIKSEIKDRHPYTYAVHSLPASDGLPNPHVHVMFTARTHDGIERDEKTFFLKARWNCRAAGGAKRDREWMHPRRLRGLRKSWEVHCNNALAAAGMSERVDCRSLKDQGIDRDPEPKLSPYESMLWKQGIRTNRVERILLLRSITARMKRQKELEAARDSLRLSLAKGAEPQQPQHAHKLALELP